MRNTRGMHNLTAEHKGVLRLIRTAANGRLVLAGSGKGPTGKAADDLVKASLLVKREGAYMLTPLAVEQYDALMSAPESPAEAKPAPAAQSAGIKLSHVKEMRFGKSTEK